MEYTLLTLLSTILLGASSFVPTLPFICRGCERSTLLAYNGLSEKCVPDIEIDLSQPPPSKGIIVIDPFSSIFSGYLINNAIQKYGVGIVNVFSPYSAKGVQARLEKNAEEGVPVEDMLAKTAPLGEDELTAWLKSIPFNIVAVICESDSGLDYAERLSCAIDSSPANGAHLQHNGYGVARRDKYLMSKICSDAGIPVVRQALCASTEDAIQKGFEFGVVEANINSTLPSTEVIIKPLRGVASNRVSLCSTPSSIQSATESILGTAVFGTYDIKYSDVLMQEFITGKEYAIDVVSKNGVHKIAAVWLYDKTSTANDGSNPFVYSCTRLISSDDPCHPAEDIFTYIESVLTALGIEWGLTHNEVKVTPSGDIRLIEINARQHNTYFEPLCQACIGYNAFDMCLSAYLGTNDVQDPENDFEQAPRYPTLGYSGVVSTVERHACVHGFLRLLCLTNTLISINTMKHRLFIWHVLSGAR